MTDPRGATPGPSVGARLRAARERAGLSSLQAAAKLHLEPRMIEALEAEEFAVLGAPVYVRGHLRRYAELLDAPANELLDAYGAQVAASAQPDVAQLRATEPVRAPRQLAGPVIGVIVAATVIAGIWLALQGLPTATPTRAVPAATAVKPGSPQPVAPVATPAVEAVPEAPMSPMSPMSPGPGSVQLALAVRSDSWVEVYDAGGKRLYYDLARAPGSLSLSGTAPLRVLLGYADGVAVAVDGRAVEVPAGLRRGRSASFAVAAGGALGPPP